MIHRERIKPPEYVYPFHEWKIVEKRFYPRYLGQMETIFAIGNGYMGMRGTFEEGAPVYRNGTFINGFYESWPIVYGEEAYGFAKTGQTMVKAPEAKIVRLYVDDEPFELESARLVRFERTLDMRNGTLDREVLWETPAGKHVCIKSRRLTSLEHRHLAVVCYEATVLNARAPVTVISEIFNEHDERVESHDPRRARNLGQGVLVPRSFHGQDGRILLSYSTRSSRLGLGCGVDHVVETENDVAVQTHCDENGGRVVFSADAEKEVPVRIVKYITYHTSDRASPQELRFRGERTLDRAVKHGCQGLLESQRKRMADFWERSDIQVCLDPAHAERKTVEFQQAVRFNLFHVFQASARAEGAGIPAKGLTGEGYEGHYFWDVEIYVLPFLVYTHPRLAENVLRFRYRMLDEARQRARQVNQKGALFPWRTINGEEASAYYAAGTAQVHINADIVYALKKYVESTGDDELLLREGAEMLVETARFWCDLGFYSSRRGGRFGIHGVTGPDEYNTVVDNNTYTNLMARENLRYAAAVVERIHQEHPERYAELVDRAGIRYNELKQWREAADRMYIPYDEALGIHPQDDSFLDKEPWDFANTPKDKYPLLLHYHPLVIYRHRVIKQADVVLALFLLGDEFSLEEKRRNFDYYDPLTTGDSSLSVGIQSIVAWEVGLWDKAVEYGRYAVLMDLADIGGNVNDGVHVASMGATWMALVYGLAGMREEKGGLAFRPHLPRQLERLRFPLRFRGRVLEVDVHRETVTYALKEGGSLTLRHEDEEIVLSSDSPVCIKKRREKQP